MLDPSTAPPADDEIDVGWHPLQVMTQLKLTGTAHFEGVFRMSYVSPNGDEIPLTASEGAALSMHRDGIIRWVAQTNHLPLGHTYHLRLRFIATQDEFPEEHRLAMDPVDIALPVYIPATGMRAPAVSTGQDLVMGSVDPYWSYIPGVASGNLSQRGSPAIVDTAYNYSNRDLWPWAMRTLAPANNVNYVNGKPLSRFDLEQTDKPSKDGYRFRIYQSDGLVPGYNVLDFVWLLKHPPRADGVVSLFAPWYVIRVDFNMIFREMHNR